MEFIRAKNTDTRILFPIQKSDTTFITSAAGLDSEFALLGAHGAAAPSFADCTHEATEIGTTGIYYLDVSAAEVNDDQGSVIQVKSSSAGAIVQVILINTALGSTTEVATAVDAVVTNSGIKKNTEKANFTFFVALASDHVTGATGKTVAVTRSIDGGAFAACANSPATEISGGWYKITLAAADLNGDVIALSATAAACDATGFTIIASA
jgi:hypothetical protein